jgi:hypothetical protein
MKIIRYPLLLAMALILASCSSVSVVVDQNKSTDFSKYKTYSFLGWQNHSDKDLSVEDKGYLRDAFTKEFERRGLQKVNSGGDMQISLYIVLSVETAVSGYNDYVGGHGSYYHYHRGYATGNMNNTYTQREKEVGTLIMNVYDRESKDQIWQAIATSAVQTNPAKRERSIPAKVKNLMSYFPVKPK